MVVLETADKDVFLGALKLLWLLFIRLEVVLIADEDGSFVTLIFFFGNVNQTVNLSWKQKTKKD